MSGRLDAVVDGGNQDRVLNAFANPSPVHHHRRQIHIDRPRYQQDQFDQSFGYVPDTRSLRSKAIRGAKSACGLSRKCLRSNLFRFFPILRWLPRYNIRRDLLADVIAGLTVGIMHIPQGMAYASLAGLPPVYGLYTSFFPSLIYVFLGTSGHISLGTFAVASLMVGSVRYQWIPDHHHDMEEGLDSPLLSNDTLAVMSSTISTTTSNSVRTISHNVAAVISTTAVVPSDGDELTPIVVVTALTFMVGAVQLIMGFLRLGFLSVYLSDQLVSGFTTGAAVMVFTAQIDKVLGVTIRRFSGIGKLYYTYRELALALPRTNVATLVTSVLCMIAIYCVKEFINARFKKRLKMPVPIDLIVIILVTLASYLGGFNKKFAMPIVNHIPTGLPSPVVPRFSIMPSMVGDAISLAIVVFSISVSMGKIFAKRHNYKIDPNQEWRAYGVMHTLSSFLSCHVGSASLTRTSVLNELGCRTQIAGVVACAVVLIVLLLVGPLFECLPMCVLASIIIVALKGMFMQFKELPPLWKISPIDFAIWIVAFLATCILDVTLGLAFSVMFAVVTVVLRSQWPHISMQGRIPNTELFKDVKFYSSIEELHDVKIFRFDAPLYYGNAESFRDRLYDMCNVDLETIHREMHRLGYGLDGKSPSKRASVDKDAHNHVVSDGLRPPASITTSSELGGAERGGEFYGEENSPITCLASDLDSLDGHSLYTTADSTPKIGQNRRLRMDSHTTSASMQPAYSSYPLMPTEGVLQASGEVPRSLSEVEEMALRCVSMKEQLPAWQDVPRAVIIDGTGFGYVDMMGIFVLKQVYKELSEIGVKLYFAGLKIWVRNVFRTSDIYNFIPRECFFVSVPDAVCECEMHLDVDARGRERATLSKDRTGGTPRAGFGKLSRKSATSNRLGRLKGNGYFRNKVRYAMGKMTGRQSPGYEIY